MSIVARSRAAAAVVIAVLPGVVLRVLVELVEGVVPTVDWEVGLLLEGEECVEEREEAELGFVL